MNQLTDKEIRQITLNNIRRMIQTHDTKHEKLYVETGHVLKYPEGQDCALCGKPMHRSTASSLPCPVAPMN